MVLMIRNIIRRPYEIKIQLAEFFSHCRIPLADGTKDLTYKFWVQQTGFAKCVEPHAMPGWVDTQKDYCAGREIPLVHQDNDYEDILLHNFLR